MSLKKQFNIQSSDYPLNIFEICKRISNVDIQALPFKTPDLRGMVSLAQNDKQNNLILVNSNKSFQEQNFHGFHELMHIPTADQAGTILSCYETTKPNQDSYTEWLANEGAAEFLVPYEILLPMIKDEYEDMCKGVGTRFFCEIHSRDFNVSPIVLQNRIESLKYEINQYMDGIPLGNIEILSKTKLEQRNIMVKSLVDLENERLGISWQSAI